jgi:hypothetical protein
MSDDQCLESFLAIGNSSIDKGDNVRDHLKILESQAKKYQSAVLAYCPQLLHDCVIDTTCIFHGSKEKLGAEIVKYVRNHFLPGCQLFGGRQDHSKTGRLSVDLIDRVKMLKFHIKFVIAQSSLGGIHCICGAFWSFVDVVVFPSCCFLTGQAPIDVVPTDDAFMKSLTVRYIAPRQTVIPYGYCYIARVKVSELEPQNQRLLIAEVKALRKENTELTAENDRLQQLALDNARLTQQLQQLNTNIEFWQCEHEKATAWQQHYLNELNNAISLNQQLAEKLDLVELLQDITGDDEEPIVDSLLRKEVMPNVDPLVVETIGKEKNLNMTIAIDEENELFSGSGESAAAGSGSGKSRSSGECGSAVHRDLAPPPFPTSSLPSVSNSSFSSVDAFADDGDAGDSFLLDPTELSSDPAALPPSGPERKRAGDDDDDDVCSGSSNEYNNTSTKVTLSKMSGFSWGWVPESKRHKGVAGGVPSAVLR